MGAGINIEKYEKYTVEDITSSVHLAYQREGRVHPKLPQPTEGAKLTPSQHAEE